MTNTTIQVPSLHNPRLQISLAAVRPDVGCTFGMLAVILPLANHDLENHQRVSDKEADMLDLYFTQLANHLYRNMSGGDLKLLKQALNNLPC